MEIMDLIRNADSAPKVLSALSTYVESLRGVAAFPDSLLRLPLEDSDDVARRLAGIVGVVSLASQNLRIRETAIAKDALHVFAAALWRLSKAGPRQPYGVASPRRRKGYVSWPR